MKEYDLKSPDIELIRREDDQKDRKKAFRDDLDELQLLISAQIDSTRKLIEQLERYRDRHFVFSVYYRAKAFENALKTAADKTAQKTKNTLSQIVLWILQK